MIRLSTFGSVDVQDDDAGTAEALLAQPKRLALLIYLATARPSGFHRRDTLLALFWPELDDARARDALNQALSRPCLLSPWRAWEGKRDLARATRNPAKFIELWQDANPELQPPVAEARRRIARLKAAARRD